MFKIETIKLWTARALRDFPELRYVNKREELIAKVRELSGKKLRSSTIERVARFFQNKLHLYQPDKEVEDKVERLEKEDYYRNYFSPGGEI